MTNLGEVDGFQERGPSHHLAPAPESRGAVWLRPRPWSPLAPGSLPRESVRGLAEVAGGPERERGEGCEKGGDSPRPLPRADRT